MFNMFVYYSRYVHICIELTRSGFNLFCLIFPIQVIVHPDKMEKFNLKKNYQTINKNLNEFLQLYDRCLVSCRTSSSK